MKGANSIYPACWYLYSLKWSQLLMEPVKCNICYSGGRQGRIIFPSRCLSSSLSVLFLHLPSWIYSLSKLIITLGPHSCSEKKIKNQCESWFKNAFELCTVVHTAAVSLKVSVSFGTMDACRHGGLTPRPQAEVQSDCSRRGGCELPILC